MRPAPDLIAAAAQVLRPHRVDDRMLGAVGAALRTPTGEVFRGVSIDTTSGTGFCAEHAAVAAMVTAGHYEVEAIVAVWRDGGGQLHAVPPCGRCREFIQQISPANRDAWVVLGVDEQVPLHTLLPRNDWPGRPLDD